MKQISFVVSVSFLQAILKDIEHNLVVNKLIVFNCSSNGVVTQRLALSVCLISCHSTCTLSFPIVSVLLLEVFQCV